ncbi:hypothetical protein L7F22_023813 [Adiantum nelumboides]|nr:hypothetical protein [Adiantum nelumboides]
MKPSRGDGGNGGSASAAVTIGGHVVGRTFALSRSVRRGCPLAPYLFLFFAETMALYLRERTPQIRGLHMPVDASPDLVEQEYVDDTMIFYHYDSDTLNRLQSTLSVFCCASGSLISWHKSSGFVVGVDDVCTWGEHQGFTWVAPGQTCRYLGFHVGQLVVAALLDRGFNVRAILRDPKKASAVFGEASMDKMQVFVGDIRKVEELEPTTWEVSRVPEQMYKSRLIALHVIVWGVTHVICCTGTTAFPSKRWDGDNTPENTGHCFQISQQILLNALPKTVQRFVLVSSIGVTKFDQLPWNIMNLFGVLKFKKMGEDHLRKSGIPFTIIRAGRLTDGPYTSYDLNTLLKATAGTRRRVMLGQGLLVTEYVVLASYLCMFSHYSGNVTGDKLVGEASRIVVAEACIQSLDIDCTCGQIYEINSVEVLLL